MLSLLAACIILTTPSSPAEAPPVEPRLYINETSLGVVLGYNLNELSFVASHCEAINRYTEQILFIPALPPPKARIELINSKDAPSVSVRNLSGEILTQINVNSPRDISEDAAEAAACTWLARAALAGGRSYDKSPIWLRQALKLEVIALLKPAMVDWWYRQGRSETAVSLKKIIKGQASDREAFLFWRAIRSEIGSNAEQTKVLISAAQGEDFSKLVMKNKPLDENWWLVARANLLLNRIPASLSMKESSESLDDLSRFVLDLGKGDRVLTGPQVVKNRQAKGVQMEIKSRIVALRRELLRQNPVYHNAWRTLGTWLENFSTASPEELDEQWNEFLKERTTANELRKEIEGVISGNSGNLGKKKASNKLALGSGN
jgi:hypothetical protein